MGASGAAVVSRANNLGEAMKSNRNCDLGSVTGFVQCILTEEELAHSAGKKDCPDETLKYLTDTTFKSNSPLEFVIDSYSVD